MPTGTRSVAESSRSFTKSAGAMYVLVCRLVQTATSLRGGVGSLTSQVFRSIRLLIEQMAHHW